MSHQPRGDGQDAPDRSEGAGDDVTPDPLRRLKVRLADIERQKAEKDAERERVKAEKGAERERVKAEKGAERDRVKAEKTAGQIAEAEELYAREEEKALAREERRRARKERTIKRQPERVTLGATLRQALWQFVMIPVGGVTVKGTFPEGPLVIVPNHTSHIDTVAMMAGVPTVMRVIPVAAADYWFRTPTRAWVARRLIGAFPVERGGHGAYRNLRELLRPRVEEACSILIFAEGTRSPDGHVQEFKAGPALLARDFDIPLLPVAVVGAYDAWPKGGRLRYSPVELRVGEPVEPSDDIDAMTAQARERIIAMIERGPAEQSTSALFAWMHERLGHPVATVAFFGVGLANTVLWMVPAEASIALFAVARRDRQFLNIAAVSLGSLVGVGACYLLAHGGIRSPQWLTTSGSRASVRRLVAHGGIRQVFWRTIEGAPDISVAEAAADNDLPVGQVLAAVTAGNLVRSGVMVGAVAALRGPLGKYVRQRYGMYLGVASTGVAAWIGARAVRWWGRRR